MDEKFDYKKVQQTINELEEYFDEFAEKVRWANQDVMDHLNNGPTLYGDYGKALLRLWEENSSTFGDFKANFDDWVKMVTLVGINNEKFEDYISKTANQMTQSEFNDTYYGKKVQDRKNGGDSGSTSIDSDDYDGEITRNGNLKRYTNENGIVEKTVFYNPDGSIKEYNIFEVTVAGTSAAGATIYKTVCTHYIPDGNGGFKVDNSSQLTGFTEYTQVLPDGSKYSSSSLESAKNYTGSSTSSGHDGHNSESNTESVTETNSNPLENLSDGQYYYDSSKSNSGGSYRDPSGRSYGSYTYYGTGPDGTAYYTRGSSGDLYKKNSNGVGMVRTGIDSGDCTVYTDSNIGNAKSDYDAQVAATTFTFDSSATSKRDPNIVRGGHTFQYFGTSSDGTMYYKYQSNSDTLYVFDGNNAVKITDFDATDITFN